MPPTLEYDIEESDLSIDVAGEVSAWFSNVVQGVVGATNIDKTLAFTGAAALGLASLALGRELEGSVKGRMARELAKGMQSEAKGQRILCYLDATEGYFARKRLIEQIFNVASRMRVLGVRTAVKPGHEFSVFTNTIYVPRHWLGQPADLEHEPPLVAAELSIMHPAISTTFSTLFAPLTVHRRHNGREATLRINVAPALLWVLDGLWDGELQRSYNPASLSQSELILQLHAVVGVAAHLPTHLNLSPTNTERLATLVPSTFYGRSLETMIGELAAGMAAQEAAMRFAIDCSDAHIFRTYMTTSEQKLAAATREIQNSLDICREQVNLFFHLQSQQGQHSLSKPQKRLICYIDVPGGSDERHRLLTELFKVAARLGAVPQGYTHRLSVNTLRIPRHALGEPAHLDHESPTVAIELLIYQQPLLHPRDWPSFSHPLRLHNHRTSRYQEALVGPALLSLLDILYDHYRRGPPHPMLRDNLEGELALQLHALVTVSANLPPLRTLSKPNTERLAPLVSPLLYDSEMSTSVSELFEGMAAERATNRFSADCPDAAIFHEYMTGQQGMDSARDEIRDSLRICREQVELFFEIQASSRNQHTESSLSKRAVPSAFVPVSRYSGV
ncbi:hypothetical protein JCM8547_001548 [Rhodosporidiobolus lusitaniae]